MPFIRTRQCTDCGRRYDVLEHHDGTFTELDRDGSDIYDVRCPGCDSPGFTGVLSVPTGIQLGDVAGAGRCYPYFDRNLGVIINSAGHRRQVCKARGVVPVDGGWDDGTVASRQHTEAERAAAQAREDLDRIKHSDAGRELMRMRDKGWIDDQCLARTGMRPSSTGLE